MDDGGLARMRECLYRPDPPAGLAERYLAARAAAAPPVETAPRLVHTRTRGVLLAAGVLAAGVLAAALGAFASARTLEPGGAHGAAATAAPAAAAPAGVPRPEVTAGPLPPAVPGVLLAERTSADVAGPLVLDAGGRVATVSVVCRVDGVLTVALGQEPPQTFVCTASGPALAMTSSTGALGRFALRVTAGPHVQWAISVGAEEADSGG